jgi:hypothetical protein
MKSEKHVLWRDITFDVYRNVEIECRDFASANEEDTKFHVIAFTKFLEFATIFSINIKKPGAIEYSRKCWGEETKTVAEFFGELEEFVQTANVVCVERESLQKCDDLTPCELMRMVSPDIDSMKWGEEMNIEIFKPQTYTSIRVNKDAAGKFGYYAAVHNVADLIDGDDDMLLRRLNERHPMMDDFFVSVSVARVKRSIKFIAKTVEDYVVIDAYVRKYERTCLMNLKTKAAYGEFKKEPFPMVPSAIEDRERYEVAKPKRFHAELVERAWHPSRHQQWCLDTDDANLETRWSNI